MEKRTLFLISIPAFGTFVVANLLYFWLAPDVVCKMLVYYFCFGVILLQSVASVVLWHFFGLQKATPMVVSGSAFAFGILTGGGVMLGLNAPFKTALYFLIVFSVLYLICAGYLSCIAADELWRQVENAVITPPSPRHSIRDWFSSMCAIFNRRQKGETIAEHYVRNARNMRSGDRQIPPNNQAAPPPLPGQHERSIN